MHVSAAVLTAVSPSLLGEHQREPRIIGADFAGKGGRLSKCSELLTVLDPGFRCAAPGRHKCLCSTTPDDPDQPSHAA